MMVSSGGTTKRLDRLQTKNLIRRQPDPSDRRGTLITLTKTGLTTIDTLETERVQNEKRLLAPLTRNQSTTLSQLLQALLLTLEHD
jgi:DNA-binding MarR family transcriptional regulator